MTGNDIWVITPGARPRPLLTSAADEVQAQFSPDERMIAYASNESGKLEVYICAYPGGEGKFQISQNGGSEPRWSAGGDEVYFVTPTDALTVVPLDRGGQHLRPKAPRALFRFSGRRFFTRFDYDVDSKQGRVLVNERVAAAGPDIVAVTNWKSLIRH
jgi:dipeptidyl aminopeptidase/acylaminoacyl peptidase